eukprot:3937305-Rhodomonas_salina.6
MTRRAMLGTDVACVVPGRAKGCSPRCSTASSRLSASPSSTGSSASARSEAAHLPSLSGSTRPPRMPPPRVQMRRECSVECKSLPVQSLMQATLRGLALRGRRG